MQPTNSWCCAVLVVTLFIRPPAPYSFFFSFSSFLSSCFFLILCAFAVSIFPPFPFFLFLYHLFFTSIFHVFPHSYPDGSFMCPPAEIATLQTLVVAFSGPCHLLPLLPLPAQCRSVVNLSLVRYFSGSFRTPSYCSPIGPLLKVLCNQSQSHQFSGFQHGMAMIWRETKE